MISLRSISAVMAIVFMPATFSCGAVTKRVEQSQFKPELSQYTAWVKYKNPDNTVQVVIPGVVSVLFRPPEDRLSDFKVNYLVPVAFVCAADDLSKICLPDQPYELYVHQMKVEALAWQFLKNTEAVKLAIVEHGPRDRHEGDRRIVLDLLYVDEIDSVELKLKNDQDISKIRHIGRADYIPVELPEYEPYTAIVAGVPMDIVSFRFGNVVTPEEWHKFEANFNSKQSLKKP